MLEGVEVKLNTNYLDSKEQWDCIADKVVYTGKIDEFFNKCYGSLDYRSLRFETEILDTDNYQGNAVVNYTDRDVPYTRVIEHKHFEYGNQPKTIITREFPLDVSIDNEAYYPINDSKNQEIYNKYKELANKQNNVIFGGRLAEYKYYDMHQVVERAIDTASKYN